MSKIKWATSFPLIGGMAIAAEKATNNTPEYIIRYEDSEYNDSLYVRYMNETRNLNIPEYRIQSAGFDFSSIQEIDIGVSVPLCSGLSMLNTSMNNSSKSRGADADQNKWIYETAETMLLYAKPKVFIGENAPGLYGDKGEKVRDRIYDIAKKYNYSVSFYKTTTMLHGVPQKRDRTFYFLWKSPTAPILNWVKKPMIGYLEYLNKFQGELDPEDVEYRKKFVANNWIFKYLKEQKGMSYKDLVMSNNTALSQIYTIPELKKFVKWLKLNGANEEIMHDRKNRNTIDNALRVALFIISKLEMGMGAWDASLKGVAPNHYLNAIINKNAHLYLHPVEERTLTLREQAWMMGLPHDFKVDDVTSQVIGQNVPVQTSTDMIKMAIQFINNELTDSGSDYIMQNNMAQKITYTNTIQQPLF